MVRVAATLEDPWFNPEDSAFHDRSLKSALFNGAKRDGLEPIWATYETHLNDDGQVVASVDTQPVGA